MKTNFLHLWLHLAEVHPLLGTSAAVVFVSYLKCVLQ